MRRPLADFIASAASTLVSFWMAFMAFLSFFFTVESRAPRRLAKLCLAVRRASSASRRARREASVSFLLAASCWAWFLARVMKSLPVVLERRRSWYLRSLAARLRILAI